MNLIKFTNHVKSLKAKVPWWFQLDWRGSKIMVYLFILEVPLTIAALTLFGLADPDTYRTSLWQEGSNHGWNSDPSELLYAAANYKPIRAPGPWSSFTTVWNVVITVLSLFVFLVKVVLYISKGFPPIVSAIVHSIILALWLGSVSQQAGPDYIDAKHPSKFPWYLTRGCGAPVSLKVQSGCKMTVGGFAVSICLSILFLTYIIASIRFSIPTREQKLEAKTLADEEADFEASPVSYYEDKRFDFEMNAFDKPPKTPTFSHVPATPRTQAFNALEGKRGRGAPARFDMTGPKSPSLMSGGGGGGRGLELRHHISMGNETYGKTRFV